MLFRRANVKYRTQARGFLSQQHPPPFVILSEAADLGLKVTRCSVREPITRCGSVTLHHLLEGQTDAAAQTPAGKKGRAAALCDRPGGKPPKCFRYI